MSSSSPSTRRIRPGGRRARSLSALAVVAAATTSAIACAPDGSQPRSTAAKQAAKQEEEKIDPVVTPDAIDPVITSFGSHPVITSDGTDRYAVEPLGAGGLRVVAPLSNTSENLRQLITGNVIASVDQEACMTWRGPNGRLTQPGLALRSVVEGDRTSAVTISNNVFGTLRWAWNVHIADSLGDKAMANQGHVSFPGFTDPFPWYLCARVVGSTVTIISWTDQRPRPSWDGPDAHRVELPASMVRPGVPGLYIGHLTPGEAVTFGDFSASAL